jgi:hypothetical protein
MVAQPSSAVLNRARYDRSLSSLRLGDFHCSFNAVVPQLY